MNKRPTPPTTEQTTTGYLEGLPKFVAHDGVEQRVNAGGHVVEHPGNVRYNHVNVVEGRVRHGRFLAVNRKEALGVEGGPAQEEGHHNGNWGGRRVKV